MDAQQFFDDLGVPANLAKFLVNPDDESLPEDYNHDSDLQSWQESQKTVWSSRLSGDIENQVGEKLNRALRTKAKTLVDVFGLDISKTEAFDKGFEDVLSMAGDAVKQRLKDAGKANDETLRADVDKWKTRAKSFETEIDELKAQHAEALTAEKSRADNVIHQFELEKVYRRVFDGLEYGVKKGTAKLFEKEVKEVASEKYKVELDGSLFSADGTAALSLDGKRTYKNVDELVHDLAEYHEVLKKSNVPPGKGGPGGKGGVQQSPHRQAMAERFASIRNKTR